MTLKPTIGAHISVAGGLDKAVERAKKIDAECMQIFAGSPRRYEVSLLPKEKQKKYKKELQESGMFPIYIHASYLINLASDDEIIYKKSFQSLLNTLRFCDFIDGEGVVYHPGSPKKGNKEEAVKREIKAIKEMIEVFTGKSLIFLENTAGDKKIGTDPDEIGFILKQVGSEKLKVCIDTAHSFQSGNIEEFEQNQIEKWVAWWEKKVGIENIHLLHINDSRTKQGSRNDKHANIGEGYIGRKGFLNLMKNKKLSNIPWILEVPGFDGKGPDKKNVQILRKIREEKDNLLF